jgi:hypothetical protein
VNRRGLITVTVLAVAVSACSGGDGLEEPFIADFNSAGGGCDIVSADRLADSTESVPFHLWVSNQSFDVDPVSGGRRSERSRQVGFRARGRRP